MTAELFRAKNTGMPHTALLQLPLLTTKLARPRPRPDLVVRPRLRARIEAGLRGPLTLICAAAGSGKTSLLADVLEPIASSVAWLSLDAADGDPGRFVRYLVAALRTVDPEIGRTLDPLLQGDVMQGQSPPIEAALTLLINDIGHRAVERDQDLVLVLDDYHVLTTPVIHTGIAFLLDHLPARFRLMIASRVDPPLPLARLRARGQVTELRGSELRFTVEDATTFFRTTMGLPLDDAAVAALTGRAEGWIAGLHLSALALRESDDPATFVASFAGSHRYVFDYLMDEVLNSQPETVLQFLLQTSILDRLSSDLCNAVTERNDGQALLHSLERSNLFLTPLDGERQWYRYHHLFAEVLQNRLRAAHPDLVPLLHARAAAWYEAQGQADEAVRHALLGHETSLAARLIEDLALPLFVLGEQATLQRWLDQLPPAEVRKRPFLSRGLPLARILSRFSAAETRPAGGADIAAGATVDPSFASTSGTAAALAIRSAEVAAIRALFANLREDTAQARELSAEALAGLPQDHYLTGFALYNQGATAWLDGDVRAAAPALQAARERAEAHGNIYTLHIATFYLAQVRVLEGRLHEAVALYEEARALAPRFADRATSQANGMHVGLGALLYEWNELDAAANALETAIALGQQEDNPLVLVGGLLTLARVRDAQGDGAAARRLLLEATTLLTQHAVTWIWLMGPVAAYQARLWLTTGAIDQAVRWADEPVRPEQPVFLREVLHLAQARVRLAQSRPELAETILRDIVFTAEQSGRTGHVIEGLTLLACARQARADHGEAVAMLARALRLAQPEGYVRTFVEMGEPVEELLRALPASDDLDSYRDVLLSAFSAVCDFRTPHIPHPSRPGVGRSRQKEADSLTAREREVLSLIAEGKSNGEIATSMVVAISTVKAHINSIFGKLGVTSRTQALVRARELQLL
jgi:LuxR family transcriptional regulator, maltose regulon positive regulatory protein